LGTISVTATPEKIDVSTWAEVFTATTGWTKLSPSWNDIVKPEGTVKLTGVSIDEALQVKLGTDNYVNLVSAGAVQLNLSDMAYDDLVTAL
jgi:hypothetical protein